MSYPLVKINGLGGAIINESQLSFRPFSGGQTGGTYEGVDSVIQTLIQPLYNAGYSVDYKKSKSVISTLTFSASFSASGGNSATNPNLDFTDTWELVRNSVQKELLESDHPLVSKVTNIGIPGDHVPGTMDILKQSIANPTKAASDGSQFDQGTGGDGADSIAAAKYLWQMFLAGVKTITVKQPILKLTRTTNPLYDAPFDVSNVDYVLSTNRMLYDSGVPSNFSIPLLTLANHLMLRSGGLVEQARHDGLTLNFGWLKDLTSSNKHGNKRIQYILQYEFGLWDQQTYGAPI